MKQDNVRSNIDEIVRQSQKRGFLKGVLGTLLVLVILSAVLLFIPQNHQHVTDTQPEIGRRHSKLV